MTSYRSWAVLLVVVALTAGCSSDPESLGASLSGESTTEESPSEEPADSSQASTVDPAASWSELVNRENAYSSGELSRLPEGLFGLMAAPGLRLFKFEVETSQWREVTDEVIDLFDTPPSEIEYDIRIQSVLITNDDAIDYVVNFSPAPWDLFDAPNQGRDWGTVLSGHGGQWRSVAFADPYGGELNEYTSVEHIVYESGALFGSYYGSCGRPCGLLIYSWIPIRQRLEGVEALEDEVAELPKSSCVLFNYNDYLPLKRCDEGQGVSSVQQVLAGLNYQIEPDGYFGDATRFAVQHYQRSKSIRATGQVDTETWAALFEGIGLPGHDLNGDGLVTPNEFSGM